MAENEPNDTFNPFAAPAVATTMAPKPGDPNPPPPPSLPKVFVKWLLVCTVAAGPSFVLGGGMGGWRFAPVLGMVIGVLLFVVGYTVLEFTAAVQNQMAKPVSRRSAWIAYITRVAVSVIYPIGAAIDIVCGIFAVGFSSTLTGFTDGLSREQQPDVQAVVECFQFTFTTVVQGLLLNLVLFAYMGLVWLICKAASRS